MPLVGLSSLSVGIDFCVPHRAWNEYLAFGCLGKNSINVVCGASRPLRGLFPVGAWTTGLAPDCSVPEQEEAGPALHGAEGRVVWVWQEEVDWGLA